MIPMPILMIILSIIKKAINIPKRMEPIMMSKSSPCSAANASNAAINNHFPPNNALKCHHFIRHRPKFCVKKRLK